jgi:hypothetical protein
VSAESLPRALGVALAPFGLNLIAVAALAAYDALVPARCRIGQDGSSPRAAVVIGNGGGAFWAAYQAHLARHPGFASRSDPLDDFTREIMDSLVVPLAARLGVCAALRLPFDAGDPPISFVHLAEAAGLGRRSILGVLVHPEFGPWIALRGALLVDDEIAAARPAADFDPCPSCVERPCIRACPGDAVGYPAGWDVPRCIDHRLAEPADCVDRCHARFECVYGRAHRYPADALAYHQRRAFAVMARGR